TSGRPLPLLEEGEGRGLHPPHGEDVPPAAVARDREEPGEDRAPREVDDLPGGGGGRKPFVQVSEFIKGRDELGARQGGEPRAPDACGTGDRVDDLDRLV